MSEVWVILGTMRGEDGSFREPSSPLVIDYWVEAVMDDEASALRYVTRLRSGADRYDEGMQYEVVGPYYVNDTSL